MISSSLIRRLLWALPLVFSLAFTACGPDAAPPTAAGSPPASQTEPQAELAKAFDGSTTALFELRTAEQFGQVKANADAVLTTGDDGLKIKVTGNDPVLFLPTFAAGKQFILQVVIEASTQTGMQLFYMLRDKPSYSEAHAPLVALAKGRNVVYFRINQPNVIDPVRLDPAYTPGDYRIESIVAREIARPATQ